MKLENRALVLDLIEWVAARPRSYAEALSVWRTSCPRMPVWEDALDHGFIARRYEPSGMMVGATDAGLAFLRRQRPESAASAGMGSLS